MHNTVYLGKLYRKRKKKNLWRKIRTDSIISKAIYIILYSKTHNFVFSVVISLYTRKKNIFINRKFYVIDWNNSYIVMQNMWKLMMSIYVYGMHFWNIVRLFNCDIVFVKPTKRVWYIFYRKEPVFFMDYCAALCTYPLSENWTGTTVFLLRKTCYL